MNQLLFRLPLLCLTFILCACSTPYHPPQFLEDRAAFPGLIEVAAQSQEQSIDVLLVHGICSHDASWAQQVVSQLAQYLSVNSAGNDGAAVNADADAGQILIVPATVNTPSGSLRFDALIWSPLTQTLKRQLCYDQSTKSPQCAGAPPFTPKRASINAKAKDVLIDDCLPDAVIYQGVARDAIQQRMRDAILQVLPPGETMPAAPLVVISESLGSKILFDTLLRMTEEERSSRGARVAQQTVDRMRYLVMAANQIPLLSLADQSISANKAAPMPMSSDSLQLLLQKRRPAEQLAAAADQRLTLVAFTDPNDLLSYTLQTEKYTRQGVSAFNILVSNAPTYLGLLERPDYAHLNYLSNPDVGRLIVCGWPSSARCRQP